MRRKRSKTQGQQRYPKRSRNFEWEKHLATLPFMAVVDSKSLYDCVNKCNNPASHVEDKRTAIDIAILRNDLQKSNGQLRWVDTRAMMTDAPLLIAPKASALAVPPDPRITTSFPINGSSPPSFLSMAEIAAIQSVLLPFSCPSGDFHRTST